jgi:hypothetical protein
MESMIKYSSLPAHAAGFALKMKAITSKNRKTYLHLTKLSIDKFEKALQINTNNVVTLRNMAESVRQ